MFYSTGTTNQSYEKIRHVKNEPSPVVDFSEMGHRRASIVIYSCKNAGFVIYSYEFLYNINTSNQCYKTLINNHDVHSKEKEC